MKKVARLCCMVVIVGVILCGCGSSKIIEEGNQKLEEKNMKKQLLFLKNTRIIRGIQLHYIMRICYMQQICMNKKNIWNLCNILYNQTPLKMKYSIML